MKRITRRQLVAARGLLGWSQSDLALLSGVSRKALTNFENGHTSQPTDETQRALIETFEKAGVEFIPRGVRMRK